MKLERDIPPSLTLHFQGACPRTDEAKLDSDVARARAQAGIYPFNMAFTFDVAIEEELSLQLELVQDGRVLGTTIVWLYVLEDQQKHTSQHTLSNEHGQACGQVLLNLLWLYDLRRLLDK